MALSFSSVAQQKIEDVERPPLAPVGTYRWRVTKVPSLDKSKDGKWEILNVPIQAQEAIDVPDFDQYAGAITTITNSIRFMFNTEDEAEFKKTLFRYREFVEKHAKCAEPGMALGATLQALHMAEFLANVSWRPDKENPDIVYIDVGRTAPLA